MADVFISHASEDKGLVARPIADALVARGYSVWYDEYTLKLGDILSREIDNGLAQSRYGVVVLSPSFFAKEWPRRELDGLVALETHNRGKRILPIWHQVTAADVASFSPTLAARLAVSTTLGTEAVVSAIVHVLGLPEHREILAPTGSLTYQRKSFEDLDLEVAQQRREAELAHAQIAALYKSLFSEWDERVTARLREMAGRVWGRPLIYRRWGIRRRIIGHRCEWTLWRFGGPGSLGERHDEGTIEIRKADRPVPIFYPSMQPLSEASLDLCIEKIYAEIRR